MTAALRVRRSLEDLQNDYQAGNKTELENLMRAWRGIQALPADDQKSFFVLGGYHGEPFRGAGWGNAAYWGGYCNHGNVLFPTWHRVYLLKLEDALRSIPGCQDVTLPFWDETSENSLKHGIPWALTEEKFMLDGEEIDNPLRSFTFPVNIVDHLTSGDDPNYSKPRGYQTVRYPLSGLVGPDDREATERHNANFPDATTNTALLNANIVAWLNSSIVVEGQRINTNVHDLFVQCLNAPNYTVFSNTTSAAAFNDNAAVKVVPLEKPHNSIHLAVGGFDVPKEGDFSPIPGANGDMGENDTAGFDPIFFFHHCFIDRVFWLWQQRHGSTEQLEIIAGYPGTNSVDGQGPTPGTAPNSWLGVDSPLDPFMMDAPQGPRTFTSRDCVNIETQLGYTYGPFSLEGGSLLSAAALPVEASHRVHVTGIDRTNIAGSFVVALYRNVGGERHLVDSEPVLSRWHVEGCANCQTHLKASAVFVVPKSLGVPLSGEGLEVVVHTRDGVLGGTPRLLSVGDPGKGSKFRLRVEPLDL
ncbi:tyrosinase family protein [Deinococcus cellulosilyticus]|uniref:Pigment biosynthesis-related tyrosinase n=1 Tax=Deinococcus cellulosilyticus (strain DSM 18568 / NBRC 106333 / KACC 11606 / 5516J-15) TaxID=1223518 RepID=A0A511N1M3_DEIC1|nr:tyrosinase family protein [Deinococcus cellulosilyticus]GEM46709.1 pigment biosynthesis-related tyrosinase [Deinococcus cellulosilyticus NBRC 106333 = KACC 11606]